jgi:predicted nuclease of predicted toxin-antitoxin system
MRFLVDECTGPAVARWLREQDHDVFSVFEQARGMDDDTVIEKAYLEDWILISNDKDFGEKIFRERRPHRGVVLLRLGDERSLNKIMVIQRLLENHADRLASQFVVATDTTVRFARPLSGT